MEQEERPKEANSRGWVIGLIAIFLFLFIMIAIIISRGGNSNSYVTDINPTSNITYDTSKIIPLVATYDLLINKQNMSVYEKKKLQSAMDSLYIIFPTSKNGAYLDTNEFYKINFIKNNKKDFLDKVNLAKERIRLEIDKQEINSKKLCSNIAERFDKFDNTIYCQDKTSPVYVNRMGFYLSYSKDKGDPKPNNIILNIQYYASEWLFIENYQFYIDGETYTLQPSRDVKRDNNSQIWEWTTERLSTGNILNIINAVINSKTAEIKFNGRQYYKTRIITATEKKALKNVLLAYESLGGTY